jgi:hypothetical protein
VTIGPGATIHAATIEDCVVVGMGAIIMDGAKVGHASLPASLCRHALPPCVCLCSSVLCAAWSGEACAALACCCRVRLGCHAWRCRRSSFASGQRLLSMFLRVQVSCAWLLSRFFDLPACPSLCLRWKASRLWLLGLWCRLEQWCPAAKCGRAALHGSCGTSWKVGVLLKYHYALC